MQQDLVCRGCLAVEGKFSYIHDFSTAQAYQSLLGIPLPLSDGFPEHLCSFCVRMLCRFSKFRLRCLKVLEVLNLARMEGRLITKEYSHSVTSSYPELKPQFSQTKTATLEVMKHDEDNLVDANGVFLTFEVDKEEKLSENETEDFDFNDADIIQPKIEGDEFKAKPYEVFVDDFNNINDENRIKLKKVKPILNSKKMNKSKKVKAKRKPIKTKDKNKKKYKKSKKSRSDKQIVIDYAKSAGFDITFLSHAEQIQEIEEKRNEIVTNGHNCRQCGKHFDAATALDRHKKNYHVMKPEYFMCDLCSCVFKNKRTLRSHMTSHSWVFTCQSCNFRTKQRPVLRKHQHYHEGKRFPCKYCGKEFTKTTSYFSHVRLKHASELSWCNLCGEFFISEKGVENHKKLTHNMVEEFPNACRKCDMRFKSEEALDRHKTVEGCNQPSCAQCGDSFTSDDLLKYHLVQRHFSNAVLDNFDCDRCRFRFYNNEALSRHSCGAKVACAACGERCDSDAALVEHVRLRHDIFRCEECGKQFTSSAYFKRHYSLVHASATRRPRGRQPRPPHLQGGHKTYPRMHSTIRKWVVVGERGLAVERLSADGARLERDEHSMTTMCELCGKKFRNATELKTHQRFHSAENQFSCALCRKGFKQRAQLQMHERVHTGERPYKCPECPKAFKTYQAYTRHYLIHSGLRKHVCQVCEKTFQTSTAAKMHIKTVHMKLPAPPRVRNRRRKDCALLSA